MQGHKGTRPDVEDLPNQDLLLALSLSCALEVSWVDCVTASTTFFLLGLAHDEL